MMKMETSFQHVWFIRHQTNSISQKTGAGIRCPDVSILPGMEQSKKYTVWIRGSVPTVLQASSMINVSKPSAQEENDKLVVTM